MNRQWPVRRLGDCVRFLSGGTPNKRRADFWEGEIPWVSSGEMAQDRISDTSLHISEDGLKDGSRLVSADTILAVVRGMSLANDFRVAVTMRPMAFNQDLKAISCHDGIDPRFLFCSLRARRMFIRDLASEASHGTKKLPTEVLENLEIPVPDLPTQRRSAAVIWAYDDLIENNARRIALLEQAARLLYEEWFVRLRFPGREHTRITDGVPAGWQRKRLGEVVELQYGKALKEDDRIEGAFPVYGSSGVVGTHEKPLVDGPGIIVGRKGNVGSVRWSPTPFWPIDTVYFIAPHQSNFYLLHNLRYQNFISSDAAVPGLNRGFALSVPLLLPPPLLLDQFQAFARPLSQGATTLAQMNVKLREARDILLPRVMSGEVAV